MYLILYLKISLATGPSRVGKSSAFKYYANELKK